MVPRISRFTPWLTPRPQLEAIFVARQPILDNLVAGIVRAVESPSRPHTLLVGQRGSGKTHLVALTYYRAQDLIDQGQRLQIARLPEDPWAIASYRHLLAAIVKAIDPSQEALQDAEELEFRLDRAYEQGGVIVVLLENLDEVFAQLGSAGQKRLRHFLQTSPALLLVATTPVLDRSIGDQDSPFYNFFTTVALAPLATEQALDMLSRVADLGGDTRLVAALGTEVAGRRVQAIEHLAGGQPRLWATFGQILTPEGLNQMADLLVASFDDLTPYYQDRLRSLSGQQRSLVAELAAAGHPLHVQELARRSGLGQSSAARAMAELKGLGWVTKVTTPWDDLLDGRRSYYELAEPLARLAFQIKDSLIEPIRLIVDFLSYWFDPDDVARVRGGDSVDAYMAAQDATFGGEPPGQGVRRLSPLPDGRADDVTLLGQVDDAMASLSAGDAEPLMALPTSVRTSLTARADAPQDRDATIQTIRQKLHRAAMYDIMYDRGLVLPREPQLSQWIRRGENLAETTAGCAEAQEIWVNWLARGRQLDEAAAVAELISWDQDPEAAARAARAVADGLDSVGRPLAAVSLLESAVAKCERGLGPDHPETLASRRHLAAAIRSAGRGGGAVAAG
jgi:DNA-binding MarR family transcriptional regulator